jgi:DNA polymerase-3 subunit delta
LQELVERTNYDPERASMEIEKFRLNDENKIITLDDVQTLTTDTLERDIWSLIDAINQSDTIKSMTILENLKKQSVDPNYIISMLARNLRLITLTQSLLEKSTSSGEIASALKVAPFMVPNLIKGAKKYTFKRLVTIYSKLSNLDFQIKTGQIDGVLGLTLICPYL